MSELTEMNTSKMKSMGVKKKDFKNDKLLSEAWDCVR